ncbi:MAG: thioredoxin [Candidatus Omnitrophica bacterium]|nr:thioredoxin [Candidatus Omnitrophota bacterium]
MGEHVLEVDDQSFEKEVERADRPVVVDFWAEWCGPCKMLSPIVEEVAKEYKEVKFCRLNVDDNPNQAGKFQIMSIPTLIFFKQGKAIDKVVGLISKGEMVKRVQGVLGSE